MSGISTHMRGFLMTLLGVLIVTPDALLIRLINTDVWTMVFWRGALMAIGIYIILFIHYGRDVVQVTRGIGKEGSPIIILCALSTIFFTSAIIYTTVAKTLVIVAITPLFSSMFSYFILGEKIRRSTWIAIIMSILGILIVVSDHLGQVSGSLKGDLFALCASVFMALMLTLIRRSKDKNMVPAMGFGYVLSAMLVLPFASPLSLSGLQIPLMVLLGLFILPISFTLIALGPRYIPAAEVSLLMLLETVLGPVWVWFFIHEQPNVTTLLGGLLVVGSIAVYSLWRMFHTEQPVTE